MLGKAVGVAIVGAVLSLGRPLDGQSVAADQHWIGTWFAASMARADSAPSGQPAPANPRPPVLPPGVLVVAPGEQLPVANQSPLHFRNQTLRQIAHISLGGSRLRIVLSNTFGTMPLKIGASQIALREKNANILTPSRRTVTFGGEVGTVVPPGAILVSDPVDMVAPDFADIAIDIYLPDDTSVAKSPITIHPAAWQTNYVSVPGNHVGSAQFPVESTTAYWRTDGIASASSFFLTRIEVLAPAQTGAVVAIGDSITDGTHSTIDANNRWPDYLARRLVAAGLRLAVLNAGIGGNRILNDGNGPSALSRFDRDVIAQPAATHVIVLEGINDINQGRQNPSPSAGDLIAAHSQMIERAHSKGMKIFAATLTPFEGSNNWTIEGEAKRRALNAWLRGSNAYDGVFDFEAVVRDPANPARIRPEFDPGDHLHLNGAGYQAVANAIDLSLLRKR